MAKPTVAAMNYLCPPFLRRPSIRAGLVHWRHDLCQLRRARVERALRKVPGVQEATVNLATGSARIQFAMPDGATTPPWTPCCAAPCAMPGYEPLTAAASQARGEDTSPWAGFAPVAWACCCRRRWCCPWWATCSVRTGCRLPGAVSAGHAGAVHSGCAFTRPGLACSPALSQQHGLLVAIGTSAGWGAVDVAVADRPPGMQPHLY